MIESQRNMNNAGQERYAQSTNGERDASQLPVMRRAFYSGLIREIRVLTRHPGQWCYPLSFFIWVVMLFPLSIGPDSQLLAEVSVGAIWIAALLASYLTYQRFFLQDFDSGVLQLSCLSTVPLFVHVHSKIISHWLLNGMPLVVLSPMLCIWMGMPLSSIFWLVLSLLLGSLAVYIINALMAALTLHANVGGALVMLLSMPLQVPIVILGTSVVKMSENGGDATASLALMAALVCFLLTVLPFMIAAVLRLMVRA